GVSKVEAGTVRDMLPPGGRRDRCVMAGRVVGRAARDGWRAAGGGRRVAGDGWRVACRERFPRGGPMPARAGVLDGGKLSGGGGRGGGGRGGGAGRERLPRGGTGAGRGRGRGGGNPRRGGGPGPGGGGGGEGLGWAGSGRGGSGPTAGSCAGSAVSTAATVST